MTFFNRAYKFFFPGKEIDPAHAYDLWSLNYDDQPGNLMLDLDEKIVTDILKDIPIKDKVVVDVGCGTGRHWPKLIGAQPSRLIGFDASEGMLKILKQKFPGAETHLITGNKLGNIESNFCNVLISTLTVAHIQNIDEALKEWDRILKTGSDIIITDYHPEALARGGKRTFQNKGKTIAVKNYIHFIETIQQIAGQLHWQMVRLT